jgi:hypothetical protein
VNVTTRTRVKQLALGVLLALLIGLVSLTAAARPVLANTNAAGAIDPNNISVVNADIGVYWRSGPNWDTAIQISGDGIYTNDIVALECYGWGGTVPPYNDNQLWYYAQVVSGQGQGQGWVSDHFLSTGNNLPNIPVAGVPTCLSLFGYVYGYVSSSTSDGANVRAQPDINSQFYAYASNGYQLTISCWVYGGWADGNYWSNIWFYVPVPDDNHGLFGFVNASVISPVLQFPPTCPPGT